MWDPVNEVDANSLPLGPLWRLQKVNHVQPDFKAFCSPAFSPLHDGNILNYNAFTATCSSQAPTVDLAPQPIPCNWPTSDKVLPGHLNWAITTHTGTIFWSGYDNNDGDFNLELTQPGHNAETSLNNGTEYGIHLEFKGNETMNNFMSPFWVGFRSHAFSSHNASENVLTAGLIDNKPAVVTGLLGIDGVHGGYTELHPVFSLAIQTDSHPGQGGIDAHWAFFLRNQGSEGCCSRYWHQWNGLGDVSGGLNWYFIQLPLPPELEGERVSATVLPGTLQVWANVPQIGPVISQDAHWVYLGFRLPPPAVGPELDGEISLHYATLKPPTIKRPSVMVSKARMVPRGDDWEEVRKRMGPADLQKLDEAVRASQLASVKPRPHTVRLTIVVPASIPAHRPMVGPGHKGVLTRANALTDAADAASREQLNQNLGRILPREILSPKR